MKLDLSRAIQSQGWVFDPQARQRVPATQEVAIRKVILDSTAQTRDFKEAMRVKSLREKAKSAADEVELSQEEFKVLAGIYYTRPTDEKLALIEILQELNPEFEVEALQ
jgi:hypothetical protein